jgi:Transcriptional regulator, effector-binding domain/component
MVASVRDIVATHAESERLFEELERAMGSDHAGCHRGVIWHACRQRSIDCEALVFLTGHIESKGRVRIHRLPAQRMASLVYHGEDDYPSAYRDIRAWLSATGAQVVGPKREIFLAEARPDAESVTEIQFPIAA